MSTWAHHLRINILLQHCTWEAPVKGMYLYMCPSTMGMCCLVVTHS